MTLLCIYDNKHYVNMYTYTYVCIYIHIYTYIYIKRTNNNGGPEPARDEARRPEAERRGARGGQADTVYDVAYYVL